MIDLWQFKKDINTPIKAYTEIPQMLISNQEISEDMYEYPRILYNFITKNTPWPAYTMILDKSVVAYDESRWEDEDGTEGFEYDFEYEYVAKVDATISFNGYDIEQGNLNGYMSKLQDWFRIPKLGRRWLNKHDAVVLNIGEIQDRRQELEAQYESRLGFDVQLGFEDVLVIPEKTIEKAEFEINYDDETISFTEEV